MVESIALSPDTKTVASGAAFEITTGVGILFDVASGGVRHFLRGHLAVPSHLSFSPDNRLLASVSDGPLDRGRRLSDNPIWAWSDRTAKILVWDVATGNRVHAINAHWNSVTSVAFSNDGKYLISAGAENAQQELPDDITIRVFDATAGTKLATMRGHAGPVHVLIPLPHEQLISAGEDGTIRLWNTNKARELSVVNLGKAHPIQSLAVSPDGKYVAAALGPRDAKRECEYIIWRASVLFPRADVSLSQAHPITNPSVAGVVPCSPPSPPALDTKSGDTIPIMER
jgi:WD40 repeat protein